MTRLVVAGVVAALAVAAPAGAGLRVKSVDTASHPTVVATVVASERTSRAPVVWENGTRVTDATARNLADGKSVVLALDRSRSMRGAALADAVSALRRFVATTPRSDRLAIHAFGPQVTELTRFSSATIDADIALREVSVDPVEGTALYDAVVRAARALETESGRGRVLVLLTDGNEVSSRTSLRGAIRAARRANVAVYPVAIESPQFAPGPLRALAQQTGGRYFGTASSASLGDVYQALAAELARTWRIEYVTGVRPGERGELKVVLRGVGSASAPIVVGGSLSFETASSLIPAFLYDSALGTLALAGAVGGLALLALVLLTASRRASRLSKRLAPHIKSYARTAGESETRERAAIAAELFQATERSLSHLRPWRALERRIERADLRVRAVQIVYLSVGLAFFVGLVTAVAALPTLVTFGGMAVGAALPTLVVSRKAKKRTKQFEEQLPDLLLTTAASLKAGHSFKQALQTIVDEGDPPSSTEFKRVITELQLGRPMDEALSDMTERVGSENFRFVMTAVTIQRQVGGSLAGLFDQVADTVRDRQQFARKIRSLTAMGRGSAWILCGLPFVLAGVLTLINPLYMGPLFTTSAGHMMIGVAIASMTIGTLILRKIVAFKG